MKRGMESSEGTIMKKEKKILLCVSGGIAAYKAIDLCSRLHKAQYQIKTILTDNACNFVSPINFAAISHNSVHTDLFTDADPIPHISLADWADIIVIAPATANVIAKIAHGISDDLLSATILAHQKPVLIVPAMNVHMYENQVTQDNIATLRRRGHFVLEPASGMLACAYEGKGKYPPNSQIMLAIQTYLHHSVDLSGMRLLITAGATKEAIDPMRYISNRSSGKMGYALAAAAALRGAEVTLIHSDSEEEIPYLVHKSIHCNSVDEMHKACLDNLKSQNWIIKCAAVSDFKPAIFSNSKIKKTDELNLKLVKTTDILFDLGQKKKKGQVLVGFAAETADLKANSLIKLKSKNLDLIIANDLSVVGKDNTEVLILSENTESRCQGTKFDVAHQILTSLKNYV